MKIRTSRLFTFTLISILSWSAYAAFAEAKVSSTNTTLAVTAGDDSLTTVASGSVVTLTATVKSGSTAVTVGQVNFCDAPVAHCTDIHLLGTAQLTSAGTAVLKFVPGIGRHSCRAVFVGTPNGTPAYEGSTSKHEALVVTGKYSTTTTIASSGNVGDYTLTATVSGLVNSPSLAAPDGRVYFLDTSDDNHVLGRARLGAGTLGLSFLNSSNPATNNQPLSVAVADFNGDGKLDMAVTAGCCAMNILLGNGDGTFTAAPEVLLPGLNAANNAAVGDFNGDGNVDLAISLPDNDEVLVLLGNGDGSFTPMPAISAGGVSRVGTGDFNGDGKEDLVVLAGSTLTIQLGNGDGTFTAMAPISVPGSFAASAAVGDFNGDGIPDLAVACEPADTGVPGSVTILLGNGDGTFTAKPQSPATGDTPVSIAAGDFNGDGILDLAVANSYVDTGDPGTVTVLLGNGDGTFTPAAVSPATGFLPSTVAIGDFNGDGKADLVTANSASNTATVLLGNGDGTFAAPLSPAVGANPLFAAVGDFNGDGLADFAVVSEITNSVTVLLAQGTLTATATATGISPAGSGQHLVDASYPGDATYVGSVSPTISLTGSAATGSAATANATAGGSAGQPAK